MMAKMAGPGDGDAPVPPGMPENERPSRANAIRTLLKRRLGKKIESVDDSDKDRVPPPPPGQPPARRPPSGPSRPASRDATVSNSDRPRSAAGGESPAGPQPTDVTARHSPSTPERTRVVYMDPNGQGLVTASRPWNSPPESAARPGKGVVMASPTTGVSTFAPPQDDPAASQAPHSSRSNSRRASRAGSAIDTGARGAKQEASPVLEFLKGKLRAQRSRGSDRSGGDSNRMSSGELPGVVADAEPSAPPPPPQLQPGEHVMGTGVAERAAVPRPDSQPRAVSYKRPARRRLPGAGPTDGAADADGHATTDAMPSGTGSHPGNSVSPDRRGSVEVASLDQNVKDAAFGINDASVVVRESLDDNAVIELRQEESAVTLGRRSRQSDRGVRAAGGEARESADAAVRRSAASASSPGSPLPLGSLAASLPRSSVDSQRASLPSRASAASQPDGADLAATPPGRLRATPEPRVSEAPRRDAGPAEGWAAGDETRGAAAGEAAGPDAALARPSPDSGQAGAPETTSDPVQAFSPGADGGMEDTESAPAVPAPASERQGLQVMGEPRHVALDKAEAIRVELSGSWGGRKPRNDADGASGPGEAGRGVVGAKGDGAGVGGAPGEGWVAENAGVSAGGRDDDVEIAGMGHRGEGVVGEVGLPQGATFEPVEVMEGIGGAGDVGDDAEGLDEDTERGDGEGMGGDDSAVGPGAAGASADVAASLQGAGEVGVDRGALERKRSQPRRVALDRALEMGIGGGVARGADGGAGGEAWGRAAGDGGMGEQGGYPEGYEGSAEDAYYKHAYGGGGEGEDQSPVRAFDIDQEGEGNGDRDAEEEEREDEGAVGGAEGLGEVGEGEGVGGGVDGHKGVADARKRIEEPRKKALELLRQASSRAWAARGEAMADGDTGVTEGVAEGAFVTEIEAANGTRDAVETVETSASVPDVGGERANDTSIAPGDGLQSHLPKGRARPVAEVLADLRRELGKEDEERAARSRERREEAAAVAAVESGRLARPDVQASGLVQAGGAEEAVAREREAEGDGEGGAVEAGYLDAGSRGLFGTVSRSQSMREGGGAAPAGMPAMLAMHGWVGGGAEGQGEEGDGEVGEVGMRRGGVFAGGGSLRERERSARRPGSVRVGTAEGVSREEAVGGEVSEMGAWLVGEWEELLSCEMGAEDVKREWEGPMHDWALGPPLSRPVAGNVVVTLGDGRTLSLGGDNADRAKLLRVERIAFCDNSAVPLSHGGDQSTSGSAPNRAYFTAHAVGTSAVLLFGGISGPDQEALAQEEFVGIVEVSGTGFRYMSMPLPGRQAPPPRSHHCSAMLDAADGEGERVVLVGGLGPDGEELSDVWVYHVDSYLWQPLEPESCPAPLTRSAACCVPSPVHSDALVLFGGMVDGDVTDEVSYVMVGDGTFTWSRIQTHGAGPCGRMSAACAPVKQCMVVHGGHSGEEELNDLWLLDLETFSWVRVDLGLTAGGLSGLPEAWGGRGGEASANGDSGEDGARREANGAGELSARGSKREGRDGAMGDVRVKAVALAVQLRPVAAAGHSMAARGLEVLLCGGFSEEGGYQRTVRLLSALAGQRVEVEVRGGHDTTSRMGVYVCGMTPRLPVDRTAALSRDWWKQNWWQRSANRVTLKRILGPTASSHTEPGAWGKGRARVAPEPNGAMPAIPESGNDDSDGAANVDASVDAGHVGRRVVPEAGDGGGDDGRGRVVRHGSSRQRPPSASVSASESGRFTHAYEGRPQSAASVSGREEEIEGAYMHGDRVLRSRQSTVGGAGVAQGPQCVVQWVREGIGRRSREVEIDEATGKRYIPTADDVGRRVGARVSFPGSFVEVLAWHPEAVQLDADAAAVLATIAHDRNATFPIKVRGRNGESYRCHLVLAPDRIKIKGSATEVKDKWRQDFKALLVPGKPDAVVLQLQQGSVVALNCSPAERDLLVFTCRHFWAASRATWHLDWD